MKDMQLNDDFIFHTKLISFTWQNMSILQINLKNHHSVTFHQFIHIYQNHLDSSIIQRHYASLILAQIIHTKYITSRWTMII